MRSIASNVAASYLKKGKRPRFFVRIPSANIFLSIKSQVDATSGESFIDRIQRLGSITEEIDWLGGMSSVSGVDMESIAIDQRIILCSESNLDPQMQEGIRGAGFIYSQSAAYASSRNAASGQLVTPAVTVGRNRTGTGPYVYTMNRGFLQFMLPTGISTCEDAYLELTGVNDFSDVNFTVRGRTGSWTSPFMGGLIFNDFDGWESSGDYGGTELLESWTTAQYASTVRLRLNEAGRDAVITAMSDPDRIFRIMLLSENDIDADVAAPTDAEYVQFNAYTAKLVLRYNSVNLDNAEAEIYLDYEPVSASYEDMQLVRKFIVDDFSITDETMTLRMQDNNFRHDPMIPKDIIITNIFPDCIEENVGKGYPMIYGIIYNEIYGTNECGMGWEKIGTPITYPSGLRDYAPCPIIAPGDGDYKSNPIKVLVAGDKIKSSLTGYPTQWDSSVKIFIRFWGMVSSDKGATYRYVELAPKQRVQGSITGSVDPTMEDFLGSAISVIPNAVYGSDGVVDPEKSYDNINGYALLDATGEYVEFGFPKVGIGGTIDKIEIVFDLVDDQTLPANYLNIEFRKRPSEIGIEGNDGITSSDLGIINKFTSATGTFITLGIASGDMLIINSAGVGGDNTGRYRILTVNSQTELHTVDVMPEEATEQSYKILKGTTPVHSTGFMVYGTGQRISDMTILNATDEYMDWNIENYLLRITYDTNNPPVASFKLYFPQIRYFISKIDKLSQVFFDKEGAEYGSWITGRGFTSGELIENPAGVIEGVARSEMSLAAADIDTSAFDAAAAALTGWKYAFQIIDRKNVQAHLHEFGRQCKSRIFWDAADDLSISTFDDSSHFAASDTDIPAGLDIFDSTGSPSGGSFTTNPILPDSLEISRTSADQWYNDFVLKYKQNYATNDYGEILYMTNGGGVVGSVETNVLEADLEDGQTLAALKTLCANSRVVSGATKTLTIEASFIRDRATAAKLLQYFIERTTTRKYMVKVRTLFNLICHELGDFVNIRDSRIDDLFGVATAEMKKWEIIKKVTNMNDAEIEVTVVEV